MILTDEQINQIAVILGLPSLSRESIQNGYFNVKDGVVHEDDKVWWAGEDGPEQILVKDHIHNICEYPEIHSIKKPIYCEEVRVIYTGEYED